MPITKSAAKALRQNIRRRSRNIVHQKKIKALIKEVRLLASQKKYSEAKNLLPKTYKALDKAVKAGIIKKNASSRKKSRLTKLANTTQ